jgi:hypothetical protein
MATLGRRGFIGGVAAVSVARMSRVVQSAEPTAHSIMETSRSLQKVEIASTSEMLLIDAAGKSRSRKLEIKAKRIDGAWRSYLKFDFPPDIAGTQFLIVEHADAENDLYLYQPINKRTRRIATAQRSGRFVGTDFYYEDLDLRGVEKDEHSLLRKEELVLAAGERRQVVPCWVIQSAPKAAWPSAYSRVVTWVEIAKNYPRQIELFKGDELVKRFRIFALEAARGAVIATLSQMDDLKSGSKTILANKGYSLDRAGIPDAIFTEAYLLGGG